MRSSIVAMLVVALFGAAGAIYFVTKNRYVPDGKVRPGNYASEPDLVKLRAQATAGDAAAQLWLYMLLQDSPEGRQWLDRAVATGCPPALHSLASLYMLQGPEKQREARDLLQTAASKGYYVVISELANCLNEATCGQRDGSEALAWTIISHNLAGKGKLDGNSLYSLESELRKSLTPTQIRYAEQQALQFITNDFEKDSKIN